MTAEQPTDDSLPPPAGCPPTRRVSRPYGAATRSSAWWLAVLALGVAIPWCKAGTPLTWGTLPTLALLALIPDLVAILGSMFFVVGDIDK